MAESASLRPQEELPESKRQKISTAYDDEQTHENTEPIPRKPKYKRRKIAIFFAYCGVGYQGMQKNPGAKTIEGDLEEALYLSGAVPESERGQPRRVDWARSARTDKGVSAVGQVVSGRFYVDPPGFVERLNSNLAPQIRVFGYKRTTPAFSSKKFCDRRRYVYLIPVFALDPSSHRDSLGSESECLERSERGRKVLVVMGKQNLTDSETISTVETGSSGDSEKMEGDKDALAENEILVNLSEKVSNGAGNDNVDRAENVEKMENDKREDDKVVSVENNFLVCSEKKNDGADNVEKMEEDEAVSVENNVVASSSSEKVNDESVEKKSEDISECDNVNYEVKPEKKSEFKYGVEEKERFNGILKHYEGTRNFHNFTSRTKAEDPSAQRYILSFNANTLVSIGGIDFIKCEVVGQSFMLHQIRKMIGLAIAIMRNCAPESLIETAFQKKVDITVPMAPEVGLYLDECFFTSYNQKWNNTHEELSMKDYAEEAEEFKMKHIYSHIASSEHKDGSMAIWLHSLNHRNYPDLRCVSDDPRNEAVEDSKISDDIKNMDE